MKLKKVRIIHYLWAHKKGKNHPLHGLTSSNETCAKMSEAKGGGTIYVYTLDKTLVNTFASARKAAEYFNCCHYTISRYVRNGLIFKEQWLLSKSLITKED